MTKKQKQILQRKERAARYFTQRLLDSPAGKDIARIILFGSLAKGDVDDYSDIDLAIFVKRPKTVEDCIDEITYDILVEQGEDIDPMIYPLKDLKQPRSYFAWQIVKKGQSLYPKVG